MAHLLGGGIPTTLCLQAFRKGDLSITTFITTNNSLACVNFHHRIFLGRYSFRKLCTFASQSRTL